MLILNEFVQYIINGFCLGSIYALIALGYTMVYGILKLINFAHGEFYMLGAFVSILVFQYLQPPLFLGLFLVMILIGGLAILVERFAYKPLRDSGRVAPLITALGVSIVLVEGTRIIAGANPRSFPDLVEMPSFNIPILGGIFIEGTQIIIFICSMLLMIFLHYIVMKTKVGRAMRALSVDREACILMGVHTNRVIAFTFFLGACFAAAAGLLVGLHYKNAEPYMGQLAGLKAFVAAVLGGIGIIPGAVLGALLLGVCEALVIGYGQSSYRDAIAFGILIFVLMFRPWGILGVPERVKV